VKEKEIMERWKEYFREHLNEQSEYQLDEVAKVEIHGESEMAGQYLQLRGGKEMWFENDTG